MWDQIRIESLDVDSDGDGMADAWEAISGLAPDAPGDRDLDADGDGMSNWEEWTADTDPGSAASALEVLTMRVTNGLLRVTWNGGVQAWQFVDAGTFTATGIAWQAVHTDAPPAGPGSLVVSPGGGPSMYRLRSHR